MRWPQREQKQVLDLELVEESLRDFVCTHWLQAKLELLKHVDQLLSIDQFDWRRAVTTRFSSCLCRKCSGRNDDALIRSPGHRTSKVANMAR